jgi:hypothetical protein
MAGQKLRLEWTFGEQESEQCEAARAHREKHLQWLRGWTGDDQDLRMICEAWLGSEQPLSGCHKLAVDLVMARFLELVPKKPRTGRELAQRVDSVVELDVAPSLTVARELVAFETGMSGEIVERAHKRYGTHKGKLRGAKKP